MDRNDMIMFIDNQFRRLGMYYDMEVSQRNKFIGQLDTRTRWWVLKCVVDYVNYKIQEYEYN